MKDRVEKEELNQNPLNTWLHWLVIKNACNIATEKTLPKRSRKTKSQNLEVKELSIKQKKLLNHIASVKNGTKNRN